MSLTLIDAYTLFVVPDPAACRDWYITHFGFEVAYDANWYIQLTHPDGVHYGIAFLQTAHPTQPEQHRLPTSGPRFVTLQVEHVEGIAQRLASAGVDIDVPLRDEPWGQRHIIVRDPAGGYVDVVESIEPDPEFAARWLA